MTDDPTPTRRAHWAWCRTDDHANYIDGDCGCWCHGQVEGQESLIPDPRTTTERRVSVVGAGFGDPL